MTSNPGQQNPFGAPERGPVPPAPQQPMVPNFIPPTVAAAAANPKPKGKVSVGSIAFVVAIVVAAAGLGFAGGRLTAPASTGRGNFAAGNFGGGAGANASGNPGRGGFGGFGGETAVTGQVTAIANGSITVQTSSGQNVTLQVPGTVTYHAQTGAAATDVTVGSNVQVTVTRPTGRPDASGGAGGQQPAASPGGFQMTVTDITVLAK